MDLTSSYELHLPSVVLDRYHFQEVRNAAGVLRASNPDGFDDIVQVLEDFAITSRDITVPGGNRGQIPIRLDNAFRLLGWKPVRINTELRLVGTNRATSQMLIDSSVWNEGFEVDNMKDRVVLDVEWNAKDGNLDRDLSAYRGIYDAGLIDVAVIITRDHFGILELCRDDLDDDDAYRRLNTATSTNMHKLQPRLTRGDAGGCPVLAVGITRSTWDGH